MRYPQKGTTWETIGICPGPASPVRRRGGRRLPGHEGLLDPAKLVVIIEARIIYKY